MPKHVNITKVLKSRIRRGDYQFRPFPSMVKLAAELEVDRRTAGKAMTELVSDGLLIKTATGRIKPTDRQDHHKQHLALVAPAFPSPVISSQFAALERLAHKRGWDIHLVSYTHDYDAAIYLAVDAFDGLFLMPLTDQFPPSVIDKVKSSGTKAVVLMEDHSKDGLPSVRFEPVGAVHGLLDHLHAMGRRTIACLNTQPGGRTISDRIGQWQSWQALHHASGPLIHRPVKHFEDPMLAARTVVDQSIGAGKLDVDAIFCTTGYAAVGVIRALADHDISVGRDVAVCAVDGQGKIAECLTPSLTHADGPAEDPYFERCLDWFASDKPQWRGPLLVQPVEYELFIGESTDPDGSCKPKTQERATSARHRRS